MGEGKKRVNTGRRAGKSAKEVSKTKGEKGQERGVKIIPAALGQ